MIQKITNRVRKAYSSFITFRSWKNRHRKAFSHIGDNRKNLSPQEKDDYKNYWKRINKKINTDTVELVKSLTGRYNRLIVPEELFVLNIEPFLNPRKEVAFLENKNIYNKWFGQGLFPKDYFHKINGKFYTPDFNTIENIQDFIKSITITYPIVCKPSCDTYGGTGVKFVSNQQELTSLLEAYSNFIVQEKISQSNLINSLNEGSINTIRVCLLRRPINGEIVVLNSSIRMGVGGSLDNETAGGIVCNINEQGVLNKYAVDKNAYKFLSHPDSKVVFENYKVPYYDELLKTSKAIATKIVTANLFSLDMCLDSENKWRCIEVNLLGQTIRFSQYAGNPFFREYTDEIIEHIKNY